MSIESRLRDALQESLSSVDPSADGWELLQSRLPPRTPKGRSRIAAAVLGMTVGVAGLTLAIQAIDDNGHTSTRTSGPPSVGSSSVRPVASRVTQVDVGLSPRGIASGFGFVWVALPRDEQLAPCSGGLARVDPESGATNVIPVEGYPEDVSVGAGAVWLASSVCTDKAQAMADSILRIDPTTGQIVAVIETGKYTADVVATDDAVWVTKDIDGRAGEVLRIDPATNEVVAAIETEGRIRDVVVGEGFVWVVDSTSSRSTSPSLIQIDPATNTIVRRIDGLGDLDVVAGQGAVWVESWESAFDPDVGTGSGDQLVVARFDPPSGGLVSRPIHISGAFRPFAAAGGGIWFIGSDSRGWTLGWLDIVSLEVTRVTDLPTDPALDSTVHAVLNAENQTVWVANYREGLTRIDLGASAVSPSPVGANDTDNALPDVQSGPTGECEPDVGATWKTKMVPWLTSVLVTVGSPDGRPLDEEDIHDTGSALQIGGDRGEIVLYAYASVPDLEHDPRPSMVRTGSIDEYALYASGGRTTRRYGAFASDTWVSLSAYASTPVTASRWTEEIDVHGWFQRMIAEISLNPIPRC